MGAVDARDDGDVWEVEVGSYSLSESSSSSAPGLTVVDRDGGATVGNRHSLSLPLTTSYFFSSSVS